MNAPRSFQKELLFYLVILILLQGLLYFDFRQHYEASSNDFSRFSPVICTEIVWKSIIQDSSVLHAGVQRNSVTLKGQCRHLSESSWYRAKPKQPTRYYYYPQKQRQIINFPMHIIHVGKDWNILTETHKVTPNVFCDILKKVKYSHWQHCHWSENSKFFAHGCPWLDGKFWKFECYLRFCRKMLSIQNCFVLHSVLSSV